MVMFMLTFMHDTLITNSIRDIFLNKILEFLENFQTKIHRYFSHINVCIWPNLKLYRYYLYWWQIGITFIKPLDPKIVHKGYRDRLIVTKYLYVGNILFYYYKSTQLLIVVCFFTQHVSQKQQWIMVSRTWLLTFHQILERINCDRAKYTEASLIYYLRQHSAN